jgi:hypothetical protein
MSRNASIKKAAKLYEKFREEPAKHGREVEFEIPKSVMIIGFLTGIEYTTTRRGKTELYRHEFSAGSRPFLCADGGNGQLFIVEGRYKVTERGIVDIDPKGRLILDN